MRVVTGWISGLFLCLECARALDLTPHSVVRIGNEDPPTPVIQFTDGARKITWRPPHDWLISGGGQSLSLASPGAGRAWMKLLVVKRQDSPVQGDTSVPNPDLQAWARQFIPGGATDIAFVKMVPSPFVLEKRPSTEFIFNFARYGGRESISISVVDFSDTERLILIASTNAKEFEPVRHAAISSMFTWAASAQKSPAVGSASPGAD